ncbi:FUSC family protein [Anaerotardibacter muris]|uniref:FUSC family protein n=1 Tax=Anaerotardibacter muris TaxID=2941505 RepID=UPI00203F3D06|nr:FUSC family protein [Anaerotardibacter muris]
MAGNVVSYSKSLGRRVLDAIPFIAFFVVLFFAMYAAFGVSDALIGIVFLFFARTIVNEPGLSFANYFRRACWMIVMCVCSSLAGISQLAFIVVTPLYLFFITIMNSDDYLPRNFYWLGMGYLLLLIYPTGLEGMPSRLMAVVVSIVFTALFVYLMRAVYRKTGKLDAFTRDEAYLRRAFSDVGEQLQALAESAGRPNEAAPDLHPKSTFAIAQEYARLEYGTVFRQNGLLSGRQCYTFALLLACEQIADIAHAAAKNRAAIDSTERTYLFDLAAIFCEYGKSNHDLLVMTDRLERFLETHHLNQSCYEESWSTVLEALIRTLRDTSMQHDETTPLFKGLRYRLRFLCDNFSFKHTQTRFALRLALIVEIAVLADLFFTDLSGAQFGIWIPITAFAVTNTYNDETLRSTIDNAFGTLVGLGVFMLFVQFIPEPYRMYAMVPISYLIILMDIHPILNTMAGTQMALTALYPVATLEDALFGRLFLVFVAVTFVMMVVFSILRTKRSTAIKTKIQELERIDARLAAHIHQGLDLGHVSLWRTVQLLYYTHMNAWLLEELAHDLNRAIASYSIHKNKTKMRKKWSESDRHLRDEVQRVLQANYQFAMDAEHAVMLLDPRRIPEQLVAEGIEGAGWGEPLETCSAADLAAMLDLSEDEDAMSVSVSDLDHSDADTTARIRHIDATAERLDEKIHQLEELHVLEDIPEHDIFGTTDEFSVVGDHERPALTAAAVKKRTRLRHAMQRGIPLKKKNSPRRR